MEPIVGSSSSSLKAAPDNDKSITVGGPATVMTQIRSYPVATSGPVSINNNSEVIALIAKEIAIANHSGLEVAVVIGGQNIFCGDTRIAATGIDRATTDQMGIMASLMNAIMHQASLEKLGVETIDPCDLATVHADVVLKGTTVDSIYNCHSRNSNGSAFEHISFRELVSRGFTAMDMTALNICEENSIPVVIFNLSEPGNVSKALNGDQIVILIDPSGRII
ncbi:uridylate kinase PUMPKIN, chloroplastic-like [Musa acuminata AAA Group]|uniref:uridylate kinase PUMPKIN, chloroplastic-like n=1 Tax=Musa acuminata AAA Group TaxID=214697 RepID=UPI0031CE304F